MRAGRPRRRKAPSPLTHKRALMPSPLRSLAELSQRAVFMARYLLSDSQYHIWLRVCASAALDPSPRNLQTLRDLTRAGLPPWPNTNDTARACVESCLGGEKSLPALRVLVEGGVFKDEINPEGHTPLTQALHWQNKAAVLLLAPLSSFDTPGDRQPERGWVPDIARSGPLSQAAEQLDPECAEICLRFMSPEQRLSQATHALRELARAMEHSLSREEDELGSTLDAGSRKLSDTPPVERAQRFCRALFDSIEPDGLALIPERLDKFRAWASPASWSVVRSALEASALSRSAPPPKARATAAPSSRQRL